MYSGQLTREQLGQIERVICRHRHYLDCLTGRMTQKHFPPGDELFKLAEDAREAVGRLCEKLAAMKVTAAEEPILPP